MTPPWTQSVFFSLSRPPYFKFRPWSTHFLNRSITNPFHRRRRRFAFVCACASRAVVDCAFILFFFLSLYPLAFGEGEIISNYRESRRCRPSSCACLALTCGLTWRVRTRPAARELAIWRLSGLSSSISVASEALAHAVGSLCLFTVIRYSFSETPINLCD